MPTRNRPALLLLALLGLNAPAFASHWFEFQPAYDTDLKVGTVRLEGGAAREDLKAYGFVDINGERTGLWKVKHPYGEARVMQGLGTWHTGLKEWSLTAEYNGGEGIDSIVRAGLVLNKSLWSGNAIALKLYPVASRDHDAQVSIYFKQKLTEKLSTFLVFDYDFGDWVFGEDQTYFELELRYQVSKRFGLFAQAREFRRARNWSLDPALILGTKISF